MKINSILLLISFLAVSVNITLAQTIKLNGKWIYDHPEIRLPNSEEPMQLYAGDIDSEHKKPVYIQFFEDKTFESKYVFRHKAFMKFGTYQMISDGKYVEIAVKADNNTTTLERHEVIEIGDKVLKLKYKSLIFVYKRELSK